MLRSIDKRTGFRFAAGALVAAAALAACTPPPTGGGPTVPSESITAATFEWTVSDEANTGAFNGQCNFMSAGKSDGFAGTYAATSGNATVLKLTGPTTYAPISNYATRCQDRNGTTVTAGGSARLGQKVRFTGGTGTYTPSTGATTIQWTGIFSVNFYGTLVPFWIVNPKLVLNSAGAGQLTATIGGYASSQDDPTVRTLLAERSNVAIATFTGVADDDVETFSATPNYAGVTYESGATPQNRVTPGWGAWPTPFISFQEQTGLASYWYTSGGAADARKAPAAFAVDLNRA